MSDLPWYHAGLKFTCTQCGDCCSGTPCLPVGARLIGGRPARMMGFEFAVLFDCGELLLEVVERSTASLNSFTCFSEAVPGFLGGGLAFLTVSVEPMLIACHLSVLPLS